MAKTKRKAGRPSVINWNKFQLQWKNKTNSEIAKEAGCSVVNVFLKRKRLIAKAEQEGKNTATYICTKAKWTRGKHVTSKKVAAPETKAETQEKVEA